MQAALRGLTLADPNAPKWDINVYREVGACTMSVDGNIREGRQWALLHSFGVALGVTAG